MIHYSESQHVSVFVPQDEEKSTKGILTMFFCLFVVFFKNKKKHQLSSEQAVFKSMCEFLHMSVHVCV